MASNYGSPSVPKLLRSLVGSVNRSSQLLPAVDSESIFLGSFVSLTEFGVRAWQAGDYVYGFVQGMRKKNGNFPLFDDSSALGTVTNATTFAPVKYTFTATNDDSTGATAKRELLDIMPILPGDILSVTLSNNAGTAAVNRGTTVAFGTTKSSANIGVFLPIEPDAPFALTESASETASANTQFQTVRLDDNYPEEPTRVFVHCVKSYGSLVTA
jgi:hypothetical protein